MLTTIPAIRIYECDQDGKHGDSDTKLSRLHSNRRNQGDSRLEEEEQRKIGEGLVGISEFSFSVIAEFVTTAYIIAATDFTRWAKPNYQLSGQAQYRPIELA